MVLRNYIQTHATEQEVIRSMKTPVNFPIVLQGQPLYSLSMCLPYEAKYIKISQQGTDA